MTPNNHHQLIILGSGPAGFTAAIYAARANLKPLVLMGNEPGGQLTITTEVENYPGYPSGTQGPDMMQDFEKQAARFGSVLQRETALGINLQQAPFQIQLQQNTLSCNALIIATGASAKWLGLPSEEKLRNHGISACATCDGFFFRGKPITVVGGGDTAMEEALFLTNFGESVTVIHRRDSLRASSILQQRAQKHPKIRFLWNSVIKEVLGSPQSGVTGLRIQNTQSQEETQLNTQALFVAIGHTPNTQLFQDQLQMDSNGYITVQPGRTHTSIQGVFACGDAADPIYRQAVTAAGTGCMAAIDAGNWLAEQQL